MNTLVAITIVVALLGGALIWQHQRRSEAASWPATPGRIVASAVEPVAPPPASRQPPSFVVAVRYEYSVDGRRYESTRIAFSPPTPFANMAAAERERARFPVGGDVAVRYDPARPDRAVLDLAR